MQYPWWRHQMETLSALLVLCVGGSPVTGEFPSQRPVTESFDGFFDLRLYKGFSKQSWSWWFETPSHPLWRHCNVSCNICDYMCIQVTHSSYDNNDYISILSDYHHQIGSVIYLSLFRVRWWNNGMICIPFYILMGRKRLSLYIHINFKLW